MTAEEYNNMTTEEKIRYWAENHRCMTEQDITPADEALMKLFGPNAKREKKKIPKYAELDVQASEPEMRLYSIENAYFETKEAMGEYAAMEGLDVSKSYIVEYVRSYAGRSDVIRKIDSEGNVLHFRTADDEGYGIYNRERSNREQRFIWEFSEGSIADMYAAFRERGIVFEDDFYGKLEEKNKKFLELCQQNNLVNLGVQKPIK